MVWYNIVNKKFVSRWCGIELYNIGTKANAFLPLIVASEETEKEHAFFCLSFSPFVHPLTPIMHVFLAPDMIEVEKCDFCLLHLSQTKILLHFHFYIYILPFIILLLKVQWLVECFSPW